MSTHHNVNVNGEISARSWYPENMVYGKGSTILSACPLYRECHPFVLMSLCILRPDGLLLDIYGLME
jgi:hypothetical protein